MDEFRLFKISTLAAFCIKISFLCSPLVAADSTLIASSEFSYNEQAVLASSESFNITAEEFKYSYEYGPAFIKRSKNSKKAHLNYMINEKLLAGYARQIGLDTMRQTREMVKAIYNDLMTEEMFREDIERGIKIDDAELDTVINRKNITVELKWLFTSESKEEEKFRTALNQGMSFDSLYEKQFKEGVVQDDRYMQISLYDLGLRNELLAGIVDTLTIGNYSQPIKIENGWYIVKLESAYKNPILNEEEYNRLKSEAVSAVKKEKMDEKSDKYVRELFAENKPKIVNDTFEILKSYIGRYFVSEEQYRLWGLSENLDKALEATDASEENINDLTLVTLKDNTINLNDFLEWFWIRSQYMKFDETNKFSFSSSLKQIVLLMVRDELLSEKARRRGYDSRYNVTKQLSWWQDKIAYSSLRNELSNMIIMENEELGTISGDQEGEAVSEIINLQLSQKIFQLISEMKKSNSVQINEQLLKEITLSDQDNPRAIDLYTVKKGGLIPRTPYPTIDFDWINWE